MRNALDNLLSQLPPELREAARALAEEGLSQLPQELHAAWIDGALQLVARGLNASVLLAYLRLTPAVIRLAVLWNRYLAAGSIASRRARWL